MQIEHTHKATKRAICGTVSCAVISAAVVFPALSKASVENRIETTWLEKAADFQSVEALDTQILDTTITVDTDAPSYLATAEFQANEHQCLSEAVYYEARSETRSGQKAVAEVILNRVDSKHFPNTICEVVYEGSHRSTGCQFSFTCDGSMDKEPKGKSWERSQDVARIVMTGTVKPFTDNATHYHTTEVDPVWSNNLRMTRRVGSHVFYRFAPRDYRPSSPVMVSAPPT